MPLMAVATALGLLLAVVLGMVAVFHVSALQDISKPLATGDTNALLGTSTFFVLLVVGAIGVGLIAAFAMLVLRR